MVDTSGGTDALVVAVGELPPLPPSAGVEPVGGGSVVACPGAVIGVTVAGSPGSVLPPAIVPELPAGGVGSNRWVQPRPASQISGHACALCESTWNTPSRS